MPNKEQKKFKEVIKKRKKRAMRKLHPKPKFKWTTIEVPKPQALIDSEKPTLKDKLAHFFHLQ